MGEFVGCGIPGVVAQRVALQQAGHAQAQQGLALGGGQADLPTALKEQVAQATLERREGGLHLLQAPAGQVDAHAAVDVRADSFAEAGWGLGLTMLLPQAHLPAQRYDYIWHSAEL